MCRQRPAPVVGTLAPEGLNGAFSGALASVELVLAAPLGTLASGGLTASFSGALASAEPVLDPLLLQARRLKLVELVLAQPPMEPGRQWPAEQHLELEQAEVGVEDGRQQPAELVLELAPLALAEAELVLDPLLLQARRLKLVELVVAEQRVEPGRQWPAEQHLELERTQLLVEQGRQQVQVKVALDGGQ